MKRIITISLLILGGSLANAQSAKKHQQQTPASKYQSLAHQMIAAQNSKTKTAAKTTVTAQRVIGEATYDPALLTTMDSTWFKYSGQRGSVYNYNNGYHDYYYPIQDQDPAMSPFQAGKIDALADSIKFWSDGGAGLDPVDGATLFYSSDNNITDYKYSDAVDSGNNSRIVNVYDASGKIATQYYFLWIGSWDSVGKRILVYNGQDEVVSDSSYQYDFGDWVLSQYFVNSYASGNLTQQTGYSDTGNGTFVATQQANFTYYPNNLVKRFFLELNVMGTGLEPFLSDSLGYPASGLYYNFEDFDVIYFGFRNMVVWNENGQGLPDSSHLSIWNGSSWDPNSYTLSTYNSYKNPIESTSYGYNGTTYDLASVYKFYYEEYNTTAVKNIAKQAEMKVYPNPVGDQVNIRWDGFDNKPVTVMITNATGQTLQKETLSWKQQTEKFSTGNITPGVYWLSVKNNEGQIIFRTAILKQ